MINIIITILLFNVLILILKSFRKYNIDNIQALIVNYMTAFLLGYFNSSSTITIDYVVNSGWFYFAIIIGVLFIVVFNLYAIGTQKVGIAITTVANKMSLIIPVIVALIIYPDSNVTLWTILAFALAILGIYLSSTKNGKITFSKKYLWLIIFIFLGQGIADTVLNYAQNTSVEEWESSAFFSVLFIMAAFSGCIMLIIKGLKEKVNISFRNILAGIILGIPNYGSLMFFFKALENSGLHPSIVFPIVSMGVVVLSAILGILIYNEKLSKSNWIGIVSSIFAIAIIAFV